MGPLSDQEPHPIVIVSTFGDDPAIWKHDVLGTAAGLSMPHVLTPATSIRHHFSPKRSAFGWTAPLPGSLFSSPPSMLSVFLKYKRGCVFSRLHLPVQHSTCRSTSLALTSPRSCHNAAQATPPPLFPEDALPSLNASVPPSPS